MPGFKNFKSQNSQFPGCIARPGFLRVIPSLMMLTTAMAWGVSAQAGGVGLDGALRGGTGVTVAAGPAVGAGLAGSVGVGLGATTGVKAGSGAASGGAATSVSYPE